MAVGSLIYSKYATKPTQSKWSADPKESFDHSEKQQLISDRADNFPYESKNRQLIKIGDKRYDEGYTCKDYINELLVTCNSYARYAGDVIDF